MIPITFVQSVKTVVGCGSVKNVGELAAQAGYRKAFLVFDAGVKAAGLVERITGSLEAAGIGYAEYSDVVPNPPSTVVDNANAILQRQKCDFIIAVGGGSAIDTAKGINIIRINGGKILDYASKPIDKPCPGLIAIPTTAGTGSEFSSAAIITEPETHIKKSIVSPFITSEYAILDPEMTLGMPKGLTIATGLDAMSHAMEAYTTFIATPISDLICEKIIETVFEFLPKVVEDPSDVEGRTNMLMAASLGGWMLAVAGAHVGHSVAHTIGAKYNIPHGAACAYAVPAMLHWLQKRAPQKIRRIGNILGASIGVDDSDTDIYLKTKAAYCAFRDDVIGLKPIAGYIDDSVSIEELAELIGEDGMTNLAPERPTHEELVALATETIK